MEPSAPSVEPASHPSPLRFSRGAVALVGDLFAADPAAGPPVASALVVHGYAEHGGRYREVAATLAALGVPTLTFDLRGHGRSSGRRGVVAAYDDYLDDLEAALAALAAALEDAGQAAAARRVVVVAHSNGALATLRLLADPARRPPSIVGAVLSSPLLGLRARVPWTKRVAARVLGGVLPNLTLANGIDPAILTHDADKVAERRRDPLCHDVASARWYTGALATQELGRAFAHRIAYPTSWLIAGADELCDADAAIAVARRVPGAEVHVLEGMHHEVFNEVGRERPLALAADFVRRTISA
jgi:alpha-beta hydrolase superfamily lysophospholipase